MRHFIVKFLIFRKCYFWVFLDQNWSEMVKNADFSYFWSFCIILGPKWPKFRIFEKFPSRLVNFVKFLFSQKNKPRLHFSTNPSGFWTKICGKRSPNGYLTLNNDITQFKVVKTSIFDNFSHFKIGVILKMAFFTFSAAQADFR